MAGNTTGAAKAKQTILAKNPDFYKEIGALSWSDPSRSHETGFAKIDKETHREISKKGGLKTKEDYKEKTDPAPETQEVTSGEG